LRLAGSVSEGCSIFLFAIAYYHTNICHISARWDMISEGDSYHRCDSRRGVLRSRVDSVGDCSSLNIVAVDQ